MSSNDSVTGVKRPLTDTELHTLFTAATNASNTNELVHAAIVGLFNTLLADEGKTIADFSPQHRLDPRQYAIPTTQWQAIMTAISDRAAEWGTGPELSLTLIDKMPATYEDPNVPAPALIRIDRRPHTHTLDVTREATDVIAACDAHIQTLGTFYGRDTGIYQDALASWHFQLSHLFSMATGAHTKVSRDDDLSLFVSTASGLVFGLIFHGDHRHCTNPACRALINDDGTASPFTSATPVLEHEHTPSYPIGAPRPGTWSFHS
jgi:hypothetical protein